ncbi:MAG: HPF/RaiA family ribosome-associated protein [Flavobacteriales bacterium]|jgi:putative sigma-54 modulation protein|nr:HPF/RaiA family ribosome-associated protein [Flavobacteriales bacterium]
MDVRFHSINFAADVKLLDFAQKKINKLDVFYDQIVGGDAYLKVESTSNRDNKWVEIKLRVPGKEIVVKKYDRTFEGAIDQGVDVLRRSLIKYKGKLKTVV